MKIAVYKSGGAGDLGASSLDALHIRQTTGNVGIGIVPEYKLSVDGATGDQSTNAIANFTTSSAINWMRGLRVLGANMGNANSLMICVGKSDSSRNMGQFYYYHVGDLS